MNDDQWLEVVTETASTEAEAVSIPARIDGVVIGILVDVHTNGIPVVAFPGNPNTIGMAAHTTVALNRADIGRQVALLFEGGDPQQPLVIGRIQNPPETTLPHVQRRMTADVDGERLILSADQEIVLRCGKASITLTKAGKVLIRGTYLLSRSSGANRIKGGSVQIN